MESTRFDMVTRHLGMAGSRRGAVRTMAVAAAGLGLGLSWLHETEAKHHKHGNKPKKRCKHLFDSCKPNGKRKCCKSEGLECGEPGDPGDFVCCKPLGSVCDSTDECCEGGCLPPIVGTGDKKCTEV
jgi:hypothetical protein